MKFDTLAKAGRARSLRGLRKSLRRGRYKSHLALDRDRLVKIGGDVAQMIRDQVAARRNKDDQAMPYDLRRNGNLLDSMQVLRIRNTGKKVTLDIGPSRARHPGSGITNIKLGYIFHHGTRDGRIKPTLWLGLNRKGIAELNRRVVSGQVVAVRQGPPPNVP